MKKILITVKEKGKVFENFDFLDVFSRTILVNNVSLNAIKEGIISYLNEKIAENIKVFINNDFTKLSAANSKAIVLLVKALGDNADTSKFTDTEKQIWTNLQTLVSAGYSDSQLLLNSLNAVIENIQFYSAKIDKVLQATSVDELITLLED
jgi:hypothetical protein